MYTPEKLITLDKNRRKPFNETFGFDTSKYASDYYDILGKQEKLNSTTEYGTSFDAISALNVWGLSEKQENWSMSNRTSGIDMIHWSIDMIADKDNNPIQVEITDQQDKLDFAANVKKLAVNHGDALHQLAAGIEDGSISLYFYKDPDGFNDRILPVINKVEAKETISVDVYNPTYDVTAWSLFALGHEDEKKSDHEYDEADQTSTPEFDENNINGGWNWVTWEQWWTRWGGTGTPVTQTPTSTSKFTKNVDMTNSWAAILAYKR